MSNEDLARSVAAAFTEAPLCYLATVLDGEPNVVPVGFKWMEGDRLLIADLFFGRTRAALGQRPRVAVSVGLLGPKRGYQIKATARVHRDGPVLERVRELLRADGVNAPPHCALEIPLEEIYRLDPGAGAGERLR